MSAQSILLIGSTGLVGKEILNNLNSHPELAKKVYSLARREVPNFKPNSHVEEIIEKDSSKWSETLTTKLSEVHTLISGLGTTRAAAGGLLNQYLIDHDLNLEIAKTAKENLKCDTYILISSTSASSSSRFPYLKMKGELEDHVKELKFNKTIILQPGALLGEREQSKGLGNATIAAVSGFFKSTLGFRVMHCVSGEEMGQVVAKIVKESDSYKDGTVKTVSALEIIEIVKGLSN